MTDPIEDRARPLAELSPAAQAVLVGVLDDALPSFDLIARSIAAAALRALADQVVPANGSPKNNEIRNKILTIAAELSGATPENNQ